MIERNEGKNSGQLKFLRNLILLLTFQFNGNYPAPKKTAHKIKCDSKNFHAARFWFI